MSADLHAAKNRGCHCWMGVMLQKRGCHCWMRVMLQKRECTAEQGVSL